MHSDLNKILYSENTRKEDEPGASGRLKLGGCGLRPGRAKKVCKTPSQ
jgi:hypothetical protein